MAKDIILGLDVGIASVGWCITNKNDNSIVKHGVRLFDTVDHPKDSKLLNETRRQKRSERRMNKRKFILKRDFIKFLIENKYVKDIKVKDWKIKDRKKDSFVEEFRKKYLIPMDKRMNEEYKNEKMYWIHFLRKKALTEKIELNQLISLLYWYLSNRGFKYEEFDPKETSGWKINVKVKKDKFPIDLQIENFKETGRFKSFYNRNFHKNDYIRELEEIFKIQEVDKELIDAFLNESKDYKKRGFFIRQRDFEIGPGSEKSPTSYGLYERNKNNKVFKKYENIWERTIGKCSLYKEEYRAPKGSFSAEVFNLLNDLNNLTIGSKNKKLTLKDKLKILKLSFETKSNLNKTIKYIIDRYEVLAENISGFKIDKKKQLLLTSIESYPVFEKLFGKIEFDFDNFDNFVKQIKENKIDNFINILNKTKETEKRNEKIYNEFDGIKIDNEKLFKESKKIKSSQTHSLSYKALKEFIPELLKQSENYSTLSYEKRTNKNSDFVKDKYLNKKLVKEWISEELVASPTVKRSLFQTFGLLNAIIKYCENNKLNISKIVVEMTRQTNNKRQRENIENFQKHLEEKNKKVKEILQKNFKNKSTKNGLFNKVYLWKEQNGFDVYDGKPIDLNDLKNNPNKYDIDHILPKSKSFDNSINNKVLTKSVNNSIKDNKTSYEWLSEDHKNFSKLLSKWQELYGLESKDSKKYKNRKKLINLLSPVNFNDPNQQIGFIQRNFVDTSYVARATLNKLEEFFKNKGTIIQTINGKMTSFARKNIESVNEGLKRPQDAGDSIDENGMKSRIWHGHHAEDAYLITLLSQTYKGNKIIEKYSYINKKISKNEKNDFKWKDKYKTLFKNLEIGQQELNKKMNDVKFSRKLELNSQLKGSEENLTGAKKIKNDKGEIKLESFKYVYLWDLSKDKCEEYFGQNGKNANSVILKNNKEIYNALQKAYEIYKDSKYPFKEYFVKNSKDKDVKNYSKYNAPITFVYKNKKNKNISIIIKKIKIKGSEKNIEDVFFGNKKNDSKNKGSFYSGLNWLEIHVYKNEKGNYQLIPINLNNSIFKKNNFKIIDKELNEMKEKYNIDINQTPLYILKRNDIILKDNIEYFICGLEYKSNRLELKFLTRNKNKNIDKKGQIYKSINTFLLNSYLLKKDFLGNVVSKLKIFIK